jgi:hypothetical protein
LSGLKLDFWLISYSPLNGGGSIYDSRDFAPKTIYELNYDGGHILFFDLFGIGKIGAIIYHKTH